MNSSIGVQINGVTNTMSTLQREAEGMAATAKAAAIGVAHARKLLDDERKALDARERDMNARHGRILGLAHALTLASRSGKAEKVAAAQKRLKAALAANGQKVAEGTGAEVLRAIDVLRMLARSSSYENLKVVEAGSLRTLATWRGDPERHPTTLASFVLKWLLDEPAEATIGNEFDDEYEDE